MTDDSMKARARELVNTLNKLFDGRKIPATVNGTPGEAAFFTTESQIAYAEQIVAAFGSDARREGMEAALAKIASTRQSAKNSDRLSTAEWHGFRVACEEIDAAIRAQIAEEAKK